MAAYNERMKEAREAKGLSYERAASRASRHLTDAQEFGASTCERLEKGPENKADPVRLWALAQVYEVPLEYLSQLAADWFSGAVTTQRDVGGGDTQSPTWYLSNADAQSASVAA